MAELSWSVWACLGMSLGGRDGSADVCVGLGCLRMLGLSSGVWACLWMPPSCVLAVGLGKSGEASAAFRMSGEASGDVVRSGRDRREFRAGF